MQYAKKVLITLNDVVNDLLTEQFDFRISIEFHVCFYPS